MVKIQIKRTLHNNNMFKYYCESVEEPLKIKKIYFNYLCELKKYYMVGKLKKVGKESAVNSKGKVIEWAIYAAEINN